MSPLAAHNVKGATVTRYFRSLKSEKDLSATTTPARPNQARKTGVFPEPFVGEGSFSNMEAMVSLMASRDDRRLAGTTTSSGAFSSSATGLKSRDLASTSSASCASTFDALQPISLDFFFPNLNGEKLLRFLGVDLCGNQNFTARSC
jgi:hypothetical protein